MTVIEACKKSLKFEADLTTALRYCISSRSGRWHDHGSHKRLRGIEIISDYWTTGLGNLIIFNSTGQKTGSSKSKQPVCRTCYRLPNTAEHDASNAFPNVLNSGAFSRAAAAFLFLLVVELRVCAGGRASTSSSLSSNSITVLFRAARGLFGVWAFVKSTQTGLRISESSESEMLKKYNQ